MINNEKIRVDYGFNESGGFIAHYVKWRNMETFKYTVIANGPSLSFIILVKILIFSNIFSNVCCVLVLGFEEVATSHNMVDQDFEMFVRIGALNY